MTASDRIKLWRNDPVQFVRDNFKVEPDIWQVETLRLFGDQSQPRLRISMQACAGPGKSTVLAWCILNFLTCYGEKGEHPKGAAVSITADNLKDNLWAEISKWMQRSEFIKSVLCWTAERIFASDHRETWFLSARSFSKTADPEAQGRTLSGLHAKYVLYVVDESGDISPTVLKAAEQGMSTCTFGRVLQAGNPTSLEGMLYAAANQLRDQWRIVRITGDPDDPSRSPRIDAEWAAKQIKEYGRTDPWVMSYILGQFPPSSINALLGIEEVQAAMSRHYPQESFYYSQKRIGVDVARQGNDRTVLFPRQGIVALTPVVMRNAKGSEIAARLALAQAKWNWKMSMVDDTGGFGGAAIEYMQQANLSVMPVNFSSKAADPRFYNKRAEMWFLMAEWVKKGGALPNVPELVRELTAPTYTFKNSRLIIEEKDQIKKRLGSSPDLADALCLTFAIPDAPDMPDVEWLQDKSGHTADYDPFAPEELRRMNV